MADDPDRVMGVLVWPAAHGASYSLRALVFPGLMVLVIEPLLGTLFGITDNDYMVHLTRLFYVQLIDS